MLQNYYLTIEVIKHPYALGDQGYLVAHIPIIIQLALKGHEV
jgi:hypothetical protein